METLPDPQATLSEYYSQRLHYHVSHLLDLVVEKKEILELVPCLKAFDSGENSSTILATTFATAQLFTLRSIDSLQTSRSND